MIWLPTSLCNPPHQITHWDKYNALHEAFEESGFDVSHPCLLGYIFHDHVQLITGSHRWHAAASAEVPIPVKLYEYEYLQHIWGTDEWIRILSEVPTVKELENG